MYRRRKKGKDMKNYKTNKISLKVLKAFRFARNKEILIRVMSYNKEMKAFMLKLS